MSSWDLYPDQYRCHEVQVIMKSLRAGDSAAVIGLSGAGKSNLLGFLANRVNLPGIRLLMIDCNRLAQPNPGQLYASIRSKLGDVSAATDEALALEQCLAERLQNSEGTLGILLDRFDLFLQPRQDALYNNLRSLRDAFKYQLVYVTSSRQPLPIGTELSELFSGCTVWLGPLSESDARWSITHYAQRIGFQFNEDQICLLLSLTGGFPCFLRAACEAMAAGAATEDAVTSHPAVQMRLAEFWEDRPSEEALINSRLDSVPLIQRTHPVIIDPSRLTAKEQRLLDYLKSHAGFVCDKDDLIRAVWTEDRIFMQGIRDDSLAQLVKRLRSKIEPDPANPRFVITIAGRGYEYREDF